MCLGLTAQVPKLINYQGIARDVTGAPITNTIISIKFNISTVSDPNFYTETQTGIQVNALGLFTTKIGANTPLPLTGWQNTPVILNTLIDINGSGFVSLSPQVLSSVPYALHAETAGFAPPPSLTFSNNVLFVGTNSVTLPGASVLTPGTGLTINSGTIVNTAPDKTVTIASSGNAQVNQSYPNFTVNVNPQILAIVSNTITLSNGGGSVVLPQTSTTPNTTLTPSGIVAITSSGTNTFNISVPSPTFNAVGGTTISGTYPNYTIGSPNYSITFPTAGTAVISNGLSNSNAAIPQPTLTGTSGITVTGSGPTYTLSTTASGTNTVWKTVGNSGTNPTINFLGTTDPIDLLFRTSNTNRMRIFGNGSIAFGSTLTPNPVSAFVNFCKQGPNDTKVLISGGDNTNSWGSMLTLGENESANVGMTIKLDAGSNKLLITNDVNGVTPVVGIGGYAGSTNGVMIGSSYAFGNSPVDGLAVQGDVGIGTSSPVTPLEVKGKTKTDSLQINTSVNPVPGALLVARDNTGNTKWSSGLVAFNFQFAPFSAITVNTNTVNLGNNVQFSGAQTVNSGGGFNTTNAQFTAPVSGLYEFNGSLQISLNAAAVGNNWIYLEICKNPGSPVVLKRSLVNNTDGSLTTYVVLQAYVMANINAGEVVFLRAVGNSGGGGGSITTLNQPNLANSFSGHLIR